MHNRDCRKSAFSINYQENTVHALAELARRVIGVHVLACSQQLLGHTDRAAGLWDRAELTGASGQSAVLPEVRWMLCRALLCVLCHSVVSELEEK